MNTQNARRFVRQPALRGDEHFTELPIPFLLLIRYPKRLEPFKILYLVSVVPYAALY